MSGDFSEASPNPGAYIAQSDPLGYDKEEYGGGGMSSDERITMVEIRLDNIEKKVEALEKKIDMLPRWVVGTGLACLGLGLAITFGVIQLQAVWFKKNIDTHQATSEARLEEFRKVSEAHLEELLKVSEARAEEFRRDSNRNYDLALKALERSIGQPQPSQVPPPQPPPVEFQTPQAPPAE